MDFLYLCQQIIRYSYRIKAALAVKRRTGVWLVEQLGVSPLTNGKWWSGTIQFGDSLFIQKTL